MSLMNEVRAEAAGEALRPLLVGHLATVGVEPLHVLLLVLAHRAAAEEGAATEQRVPVAQRDEHAVDGWDLITHSLVASFH